MKTKTRLSCAAAGIGLLASASMLAAPDPAGERFWPQWRGPYATGVSRRATPPLEWSETKNIRWKVNVPGRGSSSPVVWGDRIFLLTAAPVGVDGGLDHSPRGGAQPRDVHRFLVLALERRTGKVVWERTARETRPHEASHPENGTWASSSAITDGQRVYAWFESQGMFVYDMDGKLLWEKDLGDKQMRQQFGEGSTPVLHGDRIVIVWDHQGQSFIVALDTLTGRELWRVPREEIDTWATPLVVEHEGRSQVITNGMNRLRSYDLETGKVVWESAGTTMNAIPSPVFEDGLAILMSGFRGNNVKAIRIAEARGDITNSGAIVWSMNRDTPYVPSPLLYDGVLYMLKSNSAILSALDAKTGKPHYQSQRLDGLAEVFSSPVAANGRVYLTGRDGATLVIKHGPAFEVLARNSLDDGFDASPALVDNDLYLRGYKNLYCVSSD